MKFLKKVVIFFPVLFFFSFFFIPGRFLSSYIESNLDNIKIKKKSRIYFSPKPTIKLGGVYIKNADNYTIYIPKVYIKISFFQLFLGKIVIDKVKLSEPKIDFDFDKFVAKKDRFFSDYKFSSCQVSNGFLGLIFKGKKIDFKKIDAKFSNFGVFLASFKYENIKFNFDANCKNYTDFFADHDVPIKLSVDAKGEKINGVLKFTGSISSKKIIGKAEGNFKKLVFDSFKDIKFLVDFDYFDEKLSLNNFYVNFMNTVFSGKGSLEKWCFEKNSPNLFMRIHNKNGKSVFEMNKDRFYLKDTGVLKYFLINVLEKYNLSFNKTISISGAYKIFDDGFSVKDLKFKFDSDYYGVGSLIFLNKKNPYLGIFANFEKLDFTEIFKSIQLPHKKKSKSNVFIETFKKFFPKKTEIETKILCKKLIFKNSSFENFVFNGIFADRTIIFKELHGVTSDGSIDLSGFLKENKSSNEIQVDLKVNNLELPETLLDSYTEEFAKEFFLNKKFSGNVNFVSIWKKNSYKDFLKNLKGNAKLSLKEDNKEYITSIYFDRNNSNIAINLYKNSVLILKANSSFSFLKETSCAFNIKGRNFLDIYSGDFFLESSGKIIFEDKKIVSEKIKAKFNNLFLDINFMIPLKGIPILNLDLKGDELIVEKINNKSALYKSILYSRDYLKKINGTFNCSFKKGILKDIVAKEINGNFLIKKGDLIIKNIFAIVNDGIFNAKGKIFNKKNTVIKANISYKNGYISNELFKTFFNINGDIKAKFLDIADLEKNLQAKIFCDLKDLVIFKKFLLKEQIEFSKVKIEGDLSKKILYIKKCTAYGDDISAESSGQINVYNKTIDLDVDGKIKKIPKIFLKITGNIDNPKVEIKKNTIFDFIVNVGKKIKNLKELLF